MKIIKRFRNINYLFLNCKLSFILTINFLVLTIVLIQIDNPTFILEFNDKFKVKFI